MPIDLFNLNGKVSIVTGGNGGIGLGIGEGLAKAGSDIIIWGRDANKNERAADKLREYGTRVLALCVDASSEEAVQSTFDESLRAMGRIDFVVANAGGAGTKSFLNLTTEEWRSVLGINLDSVFWLFRAACDHMVQRHKEGDPGGSLVVVSSVAGIRPPQQAEAYAASKAGVIALTKSVASEFGRFGIRANAILPGFVRSDLSAHLQEMDRFTASVINQRVSMGRWGLPEDFAGITVYLASDLSKFHTADAIVIDGGYSNS